VKDERFDTVTQESDFAYEPASVLEPEVIGSGGVSYEERRVRELPTIGPKYP
jgi:hypothetical protein